MWGQRRWFGHMLVPGSIHQQFPNVFEGFRVPTCAQTMGFGPACLKGFPSTRGRPKPIAHPIFQCESQDSGSRARYKIGHEGSADPGSRAMNAKVQNCVPEGKLAGDVRCNRHCKTSEPRISRKIWGYGWHKIGRNAAQKHPARLPSSPLQKDCIHLVKYA